MAAGDITASVNKGWQAWPMSGLLFLISMCMVLEGPCRLRFVLEQNATAREPCKVFHAFGEIMVVLLL